RWMTQQPIQAGRSRPKRLVHYREIRPGGLGGQVQKLEHSGELARRIGKEFLEEQEQTLRSRGLRQQPTHLRRVAILGAVLQQLRIRPARRQVLAFKTRLLQSPRLLKIADVLQLVAPPVGV